MTDAVESVRKQLPGVAIGAAAVAATAYTVGAELPAWGIEVIKQVGPFAIILLVLFWYVPRGVAQDFVKSQQDQAVALSRLASASESIAIREDRVEDLLKELHLGQRVVASRLERIEELIINGKEVS